MNVIYLRDFRNLCFSSGVRSLAPSRGETVRALRRILATLGARRIVCYGNSVGGFAAVHYAADLGADAAVSLAGPTDLTTLRSPLGQRLRMMNAEKDLNRILSEAEAPPQVLVVCGDGNWDDRLQAENLAGQPTVTVRLVEQFGGHSVAAELICRQQFGAVLEWLAGTTRADPRTMPALPYAPWRPAPA
jgi:pimeloyl-ACP methyl ester carboxylesterase